MPSLGLSLEVTDMGIFVLDATTESIVVAMSGAAATTNPDFTAAWADDTGSAFTEGSTDGALNGTSSVTLGGSACILHAARC
jgi:hypothetical protein